MFLDHSDLIDVHFKILEPGVYCKTKQIVWLQVIVKNIHFLMLYVVTKHYRIVITSALIQGSDENIDIFFIAVILWQLQSKLVLWLYTAGCDVLHVLYLWLCHLDVWHRAPYVPRYLAVLQNSQKSHTNQKHGLITIGKTGHV